MSEYNIQMNKYNALNAGYDQLYPRPMKHANTHAEDGNDPITPSMIGTYNKTEIDTALQNKAPAGYGLGGAAKYLMADDDINNIWECGWYCWDAPPVNCPVFGIEGYGYVTYSMMLVLNKGGNYVSGQVIYAHSGEVLQRMYNGSLGGWQPWEWVNPPMQLGVEYRTTERYQGKPVYAKVVDFGFLPNNTEKQVALSIDGIQHIVECSARYSEGDRIPSYNTGASPAQEVKLNYVSNYNGGFVRIASNYDASASGCYVSIKYTKNTD